MTYATKHRKIRKSYTNISNSLKYIITLVMQKKHSCIHITPLLKKKEIDTFFNLTSDVHSTKKKKKLDMNTLVAIE